MAKFFDGVGQVTATTGTGMITLGAVIGSSFFTLAEQGAVDTDEVYYRIDEAGDTEIGLGTVGGSETTLSRDTVLSSRIGGVAGTSKMNLAGVAQVRVVAPSDVFNTMMQIGVSTLDQLADVDLTTTPPATGDGLTFDGDDWVPGAAGGGMFRGNNGTVGSRSGDIFRINVKTLTEDVTIGATENASCTGPLEVETGNTLEVATGGTLVIL